MTKLLSPMPSSPPSVAVRSLHEEASKEENRAFKFMDGSDSHANHDST
jgi:hypothetical protein